MNKTMTVKKVFKDKKLKKTSDDESTGISTDDYETLSEMDTDSDDEDEDSDDEDEDSDDEDEDSDDEDEDSDDEDEDSDDEDEDSEDEDEDSEDEEEEKENFIKTVRKGSRVSSKNKKSKGLQTPIKSKKLKTPEKPEKKKPSLKKVKDEVKSYKKIDKKGHTKKRKVEKDEISDSCDEDTDTDTDEDYVKNSKIKNNLIFYIGGDDDYDEDYDDDTDDYIEDLMEEHDEEEYKKEEEAVFMKEKYEKLEEPNTDVEKTDNKSKSKTKKHKNDKKNGDKGKKEDDEKKPNIEEEYIQLQQTKKMLLQEFKKRPNKIYRNALDECNKDIKDLVRRGKKENLKRYHKLIKQERKKQNEYDYFRKELSNQEQNRIIDDLDKITKNGFQKKPFRFTILESSISPSLKSIALQKVNQLSSMCSSDSEYHKIKNWIDTFMKIPFGINKNIEVNMERDGIDACNDFMVRAHSILDECTYGLKEAKLQIMQMLGNWITNPSAVGTSIAIKGPPGTGKTSLVKEGISKIMGREFVFIPLGGAGDSSYLEGHSYTYEGSCCGKIVQSLIDCKSMNPVFYFDELDKISDSPRGQEIMGILTHLTDTSQNSQFTDRYFAEINEFDLSKCLFIFSYNDESKISPILLNRMHIISTKGYSVEDKLIIGRKYLLPKIIKQVNMSENDVILTDEILRTILTNEHYIQKEDGVRNFKRSLELIYSKINLFRVMKPENNFFQFYKNIQINVSFPYTLVKNDLDVLVKNEDGFNSAISSMYI